MKIICFLLTLLMSCQCFADIKVVKTKDTQKIVYIQVPNFEDGKGILEAVKQNPEYDIGQLYEVSIMDGEFKAFLAEEKQKTLEKAVKKEQAKNKIKNKLMLQEIDFQDLKEALND